MKILEAVQKIREKFGENVTVQITAEYKSYDFGTVESAVIVWISTGDGNSRSESDTTLARAVNKILNDIEPEAIQSVVDQVEEMAGKGELSGFPPIVATA